LGTGPKRSFLALIPQKRPKLRLAATRALAGGGGLFAFGGHAGAGFLNLGVALLGDFRREGGGGAVSGTAVAAVVARAALVRVGAAVRGAVAAVVVAEFGAAGLLALPRLALALALVLTGLLLLPAA